MDKRTYYANLGYRSPYLSHYGVGHDKGGHSGRYPWGSGKKGNSRGSAFEDEQNSRPRMSKEEAVKRGSVADVKSYKGQLTNKELQDAVTRFRLEQQLDEFDPRAKLRGRERVQKILDQLGDKLVVPLAVGLASYGLRTGVQKATKKFDLDKNLDLLYTELFKNVNPKPKK